jgi:hypothetical protein
LFDVLSIGVQITVFADQIPSSLSDELCGEFVETSIGVKRTKTHENLLGGPRRGYVGDSQTAK